MEKPGACHAVSPEEARLTLARDWWWRQRPNHFVTLSGLVETPWGPFTRLVLEAEHIRQGLEARDG